MRRWRFSRVRSGGGLRQALLTERIAGDGGWWRPIASPRSRRMAPIRTRSEADRTLAIGLRWPIRARPCRAPVSVVPLIGRPHPPGRMWLGYWQVPPEQRARVACRDSRRPWATMSPLRLGGGAARAGHHTPAATGGGRIERVVLRRPGSADRGGQRPRRADTPWQRRTLRGERLLGCGAGGIHRTFRGVGVGADHPAAQPRRGLGHPLDRARGAPTRDPGARGTVEGGAGAGRGRGVTPVRACGSVPRFELARQEPVLSTGTCSIPAGREGRRGTGGGAVLSSDGGAGSHAI